MITIHFRNGGQAALVRELAGIVGDIRSLRVTASGVTVPDHIAREWLARHANDTSSDPQPGSAVPVVEVTILPPALAATAVQQEDVGGLSRPVETEEPSLPRRPGRPRKEIR